MRRVLFFGGYDVGSGYPRARSLRSALEHYGVEVVEVREDLLPTKERRRRALKQPWRWPTTYWKLRSAQKRLARRLREALDEQDFDAIVVPYPGWFSVRAARRLYDGPVILDLFLSLADTACRDRSLFRRGGLLERALLRLDKRACQNADRVLLDTPLHASRIAELTGIESDRFDFVPIGDPDAPLATPSPVQYRSGDKLRALYVGTGVPLHGVEHVLEACESFGNDVDLTFVGGTEAQRARARKLDCVSRVEKWLDMDDLKSVIDEQHVLFGIFGESEKANSVIPYKVVHGLARSRVVVTAETDAVQTMLIAGVDCLTAPAGDAEAITRALTCLRDGPGLVERTAKNGRQRYERAFSPEAIGRRLVHVFESVDPDRWSGVDATRAEVPGDVPEAEPALEVTT